MSKERRLHWSRRAEMSYSTFKVRSPRSGAVAERSCPTSKVRSSSCALLEQHEEIPHVQGKRNPSKMVGVARGHQRVDTLKPYSQKTSQSNHTRTTALSNSMKLSHALQSHPRQAGMVERSDTM